MLRFSPHLGDWNGLSSKHGLVDNSGSLHQDGVTFHRVAAISGEEDLVPGNQFFTGQLHFYQERKINQFRQESLSLNTSIVANNSDFRF